MLAQGRLLSVFQAATSVATTVTLTLQTLGPVIMNRWKEVAALRKAPTP